MTAAEWGELLRTMRASIREHGLGALDAEAVDATRLEPDATEKQAVLAYLSNVARALRSRSTTRAGEALQRLRAVAHTDEGGTIEDVVVVGSSRDRYFDERELLSFAALPDLSARAEEIDVLLAELLDTE